MYTQNKRTCIGPICIKKIPRYCKYVTYEKIT